MTPQEFYDNIMDSLHQLPLDANHYDRQIRRITNTCNRYSQKFKKILGCPNKQTNKKFMQVKRKLLKLLELKEKATEEFHNCLHKHLLTVEEYCKLGEEPIVFTCLPETRCSIIKADGVNNTKYCVCNDKASGMMIRCENPECPVGWYHFTCVGLSVAPKTEWMCMHCRTDPAVS